MLLGASALGSRPLGGLRTLSSATILLSSGTSVGSTTCFGALNSALVLAAIVTGRLTDGRQQPIGGAKFVVRLLILLDTSALHLASATTHTTNSEGNFILPNLYRGVYQLEYDNEKIKFRVPSSSGIFVITNLLD